MSKRRAGKVPAIYLRAGTETEQLDVYLCGSSLLMQTNKQHIRVSLIWL